jgi:Zn-dependent protease with chaperone function
MVTVCSRTLSEAVTHRWDLSRFLSLLPFGLGLTLAGLEALRLLTNTGHWMSHLHPNQRQPPVRVIEIAKACGLSHSVVLVHVHQPLVFTQGLFRPRVWLSTGLLELLTDEELEAVLWHESKHQTSHDPLKILLAHCLKSALFFVPIAHDLCNTYLLTKEIDADTHAATHIGSRLPLASALTKLLSASPLPVPIAPLSGSAAILEARLLTLLDPLRPLPLYRLERLGASMIWLGFLVVMFLAPTAAHVPSFRECAAPTAKVLIPWWLL